MSELVMEWWVAQTPRQVFEAIEDPFQLRRWFGAPPGGFRVGGDADADVGEPFRLDLLDDQGTPLALTGRVLAVEPDEVLWMQLAWDGGNFGPETTRASILLDPTNGGTRIEICQGPFLSPESHEAHRTYWEAAVGRLVRVISGETVPCFEEFWEESNGYAEPLGMAAYAVLAGMREAGAAPETLAQLEETLYTHLARVPEESAKVLGAVLRARLQGALPIKRSEDR
ncbi:SRPBCC domain-containing protein [Archangium violaceum]|uniref:SRPBCC family protein n=1 Tax=Archangium violaceum TaxID=83451 RepID=UPI001950D0B0|nr:SRPBCC domain-containing protein [Archangium violaceum]QRO00677.1 SRPBCC domain-containing protein [Archangium violaceum]